MNSPFYRTTRRLQADSNRRTLALIALAFALLAGWVLWLMVGRTSLMARASVSELRHTPALAKLVPLLAPATGQIVPQPLSNGQGVRAGTLLFEVDTGLERYPVSAPADGLFNLTHQAPTEALVRYGEPIGVLVPQDAYTVVAHIPALAARQLQPGQPAWFYQPGHAPVAATMSSVMPQESMAMVTFELAVGNTPASLNPDSDHIEVQVAGVTLIDLLRYLVR